jgi:hypothetical protein
LRIRSGSCFSGGALAWHGIEEPIGEIKFPQGKFFAPKRDDEIYAGGFVFTNQVNTLGDSCRMPAVSGAYLNGYVTEEQRSRRPVFIATLGAE